MNSRTCTTLSKPRGLRGSALPLCGSASAVFAFLIAGCGSSAPAPRGQEDATLVQVAQPGENGEGTISFHYSNKSTEANLAIDLGNTDLYMEMSGEPPKLANGEPAVAEEKLPPPKPRASRPPAQEQEQEETDQGGQEPPRTAMRKRAEAGTGAKPETRPEARKETDPGQELRLPEEEQGNSPDVTSRVLAGIRKAQELFYQKRYPEAMQAVKSSLDASPTAEGYALAGSIHYMMGQGGMARRQWMEALRLNPDMPSVVNMLEKTRTPGGRGSPSPRPILPRPVQRSAPAPLPEAENPPFPEVYNEPAYNRDYPGAPAVPPSSAPAPSPTPQAPATEAAGPEAASEPAVAAPAAPAVPAAPASPTVPAKAAPAHAVPAKAAEPAPNAPDAHAEPGKPAKTRLPSAKEGKAK